MNEFKRIYKKFYNQLALEGFIKSVLIGIVVGCISAMISCLALYLTNFDAIWLSIVIGLTLMILVTCVLYFAKYRPTEKDVARRVDMIGLKERLITMVEMKDDDSFMANKQREETRARVNKLNNTKLKLNISIATAIVASILVVANVTSTVLAQASFNGYLPTIDENPQEDEIENISVGYFEQEGGYIEGEIFQIIPYGQDTTEVVAVANDGYMFESWSDGVITPDRIDIGVTESFEVFAIFIEIDTGSEPIDKEDKNATDGGFDLGDMEGDMPAGGGAAGKYEEYNQVIDGETYYRDVYQEYYDKAIEILNNGGVVPEYIRIIVEEYFGVIK